MIQTFTAKIRQQSNSTIVTVPYEVVEVLALKTGDFCKFIIEKINNPSSEVGVGSSNYPNGKKEVI